MTRPKRTPKRKEMALQHAADLIEKLWHDTLRKAKHSEPCGPRPNESSNDKLMERWFGIGECRSILLAAIETQGSK